MDVQTQDIEEVKAIAGKMFFVFLAAGFSAFSWICLLHTDSALFFVIGLILVNFAWAPFFIMGLGTREIWPLIVGSALATFLLMRYGDTWWIAPTYVILFTLPHIGGRLLVKHYWKGGNIHLIGKTLSQKLFNLLWLLSLAFVVIVAIYGYVMGIDILPESQIAVQKMLDDMLLMDRESPAPLFSALYEGGYIRSNVALQLEALVKVMSWNYVALLATTWAMLVFTGLVYARIYLKATKRWWGEEIHWYMGRLHISAVPVFIVALLITLFLPGEGLLKYSIYNIASITGILICVNSFSALHVYAASTRFKHLILTFAYIMLFVMILAAPLYAFLIMILFEILDYWRNFRGRKPYEMRIEKKENTL